ncbi:MAG: hypothetical protein MUF34_18515, partial [Polyangiaceae bacterium]|nr:hypothetical protein [Polyangiaceae bacterium]
MTGRRAWWAAVAFLWAAWAWLGAPAPAAAQTFQLLTNNDTAPPKRKLQPLRNQEFAPFTISRGDCEKDDAFIFSAQQMNLGSFPLEVWVSDGGSDCTQVANRISTAATCWRIETLGNFSDQVFDITLRVQDIIRTRQGAPDGGNKGDGTAASCSLNVNTDQSVQYTLYFLVLNGNNLLTQIQYPVQVDLLGPEAPVVRSVSAGEGRARIRWTPSVSQGFGRYEFFCEEVPAGEVCADSV